MTAPETPAPSQPGPLEGVRVLHLPHLLTLPAARLLANLGADVLLLESPAGASSRHTPPFLHDTPGLGSSLPFLFATTSQRGLTADLATPDGMQLLHRLLPSCQIVLQGGTPQEFAALAALGLDQRALRAQHPALVWVQVSGFGLDGPHADWQSADLIGVAMSGIMTLAGYLDRAPVMPPWGQGYLGAGLQAAEGALLALRVAEASGEGQLVEVSMQEALSMAQETAMQTWDMRHEVRKRSGSTGILPGVGTYECADGHLYCMVGVPGFGAQWPVLIQWMVDEGMAGDLQEPQWGEFLGGMDLRTLTALMAEPDKLAAIKPKYDHVDEVLRAFYKRHPKTYLYEEGQKRRLLIGPVNSAKDLVENRQLNAREWFQTVYHPEIDQDVTYPGPPFRLGASPWRITRRPPLLGEHNTEVWGGELGLSAGQLEALAGAGVI